MPRPSADDVGSRSRILEAALVLMSEHGAAGTSMRMLAGECGLNVATLYHYFPSKADLLRAVLAERGYLDRLASENPPAEVRRSGPPAARLTRLVRWIWWAGQQEEAVWRLLVGESLRGDATARAEALALVDGLDVGIAGWLEEVVPELADRSQVVARLVRALLFSLIVEHLALGPDDDRAKARIADLVGAVLP
ncbi:MAG: TetR/AcrR family transcriptional regulator [Actinomycetota bacterium]|nr:TetR/AcrR family transcriptional regulator [Acidimicrobiia bacterium]MDQ3293712.1 TetR/AcrR family transcriptional regulator [Actinomycetota bacterium]